MNRKDNAARYSENALTGAILGMAVGDSLGLPWEALSPSVLQRSSPNLDRHNFIFGHGMVSDDTEHLIMTAEAILESRGEEDRFIGLMSKKMKRWFLCLPAGIGMATLKACLKLLLGFPPSKSGVFSAGNGPAMRSPIIGVMYGDDPEKMKRLVRLSTRLTHTDPKAYYGALAIALAGHISAVESETDPGRLGDIFMDRLLKILPDEEKELPEILSDALKTVKAGLSTLEYAELKGWGRRGVSGYIYNTVPAVFHVWLSHNSDFEKAVREIILCGGDTDTTAGISGSIVGARTGRAGIPSRWLDGIWEWPRDVRWMDEMGKALADLENSSHPPYYSGCLIPPRNAIFMATVLIHGFLRSIWKLTGL